MIPTVAGANRAGEGVAKPNGFPERHARARKQQAGNLDLATVVWKQAVVAGERKAAVTSRS